MIRHGTYPDISFHIVPWIPIHLITADRRSRCHRKADPIRVHFLFQTLEGTLYIFCCHRVLCLKILMEQTYHSIGIVLAPKVQQEIEQHTAVFSPAKRNIDVFKLFKQIMKTFLKRLIYIVFLILSNHPVVSLSYSCFSSFVSYSNCSVPYATERTVYHNISIA